EGAFEKYVAACRDGSLVGSHYTIVHILPDLNIAHSRTDGPFYICLLHQFVPLAHDRTLLRAWIYPAPFDGQHTWFTRWIGAITRPLRARIAARVVRRIFRQDIQVCERLQAAAHQVDRSPRLGALEERIGWFEESLRRLRAEGD